MSPIAVKYKYPAYINTMEKIEVARNIKYCITLFISNISFEKSQSLLPCGAPAIKPCGCGSHTINGLSIAPNVKSGENNNANMQIRYIYFIYLFLVF
jgi:hypothetical protein